jgi:Outer membrane protein and related peptidoglycan-associated (lipo)proteins
MLPNLIYKILFMFHFHTSKQNLFLVLAIICGGISGNAQDAIYKAPKWWFGESAAANFNNYRGTTQMLNTDFSTPTAFHKGHGVKPYFSLLTEYRPNKTWGGMLNVAFDNRGGKFDGVTAPCNCAANLSTNISYVAIEPSLRLAPFSSAFYLFVGPTVSFNLNKTFNYTQEKQTDTRGEWSDVRKTILSAQAGAGIDIPVSKKTSTTQLTISPFASFLTNIGHESRSSEDWSVYTIRAGVQIKFGMSKKIVSSPIEVTAIPEKEVQFTVRAPKLVPANRQVKETFPLLNSVFFNMGSTEIPTRYVQLNNAEASSFKEEQLQQDQPVNLNNNRAARQMAVYYNILNIIGDRLRSNASTTISLTGSSDKNPVEGKIMANKVKQYLVSVFGIDESRISTEGRDKPIIASEKEGGTKELVLLKEGDRRVDIYSTSPELMMQLGGSTSAYLKPIQIKAVQQDPLDSHVLFNVEGANDLLSSYMIDVTDEQGNTQHYGPYTSDQASVSGKTILGSNTQGNYKIVMNGKTKSGHIVRRESSVSLMKKEDAKQEGLRYSILFDFDQSKSIESYQNFLTDIITPLVPDYGTIIIHGHTDIIGEEKYNLSLSHVRAMGAQSIIEQALLKSGKKGVQFETYGFGEDTSMAPFENNLPEERFYNRSVIIDIIDNK